MTAAKTAKKRVKFAFRADSGSKVFVAGTFNLWDPTANPLKEKDGVYAASMLLGPGRYEYKFVVNDVWCVDPECVEWQANDHGSLNSVLNVE